MEKNKCILCKSELKSLGEVGKEKFSLSSDLRLINVYAKIFVCGCCSHLQKKVNKLSDYIYNNYDPHYLSNGIEQQVFINGVSKARSFHALENIIGKLKERGVLLDVGCGNGAMLKSASRLLPNWGLYGLDVNNNFESEILGIDNVKGFFVNKIPKTKFDLVTLWNVLEHIKDPIIVINNIRDSLKDDGLLLVQVPDIDRNLFDFSIIDHYNHFKENVLINLFESNGFKVVSNGLFWFNNCLTLLLQKEIIKTDYVIELNKNIEYFEEKIKGNDFIIFGTGTASMFLYSQLSKKPLFFLDEDLSRVDKVIWDVPILSVKDRPSDSNVIVLMPFEKVVKDGIVKRLREQKYYKKRRFI